MKKMNNEEFQEYLSLTADVEVIEDRLQTVSSVYLLEAQMLVGMQAKRSEASRKLKSRKADLYGTFRELKATDKSWTESAIDAAINADPRVIELQDEEIRLDVAVDLRKYRLESLRMLNGNLQLLGRSILNEKYGVQS
jgi:hypothetical protein